MVYSDMVRKRVGSKSNKSAALSTVSDNTLEGCEETFSTRINTSNCIP